MSEGEVGLGFGDEETCTPVHHLGDVESFGEFFNFCVSMDGWLLQGSTINKQSQVNSQLRIQCKKELTR